MWEGDLLWVRTGTVEFCHCSVAIPHCSGHPKGRSPLPSGLQGVLSFPKSLTVSTVESACTREGAPKEDLSSDFFLISFLSLVGVSRKLPHSGRRAFDVLNPFYFFLLELFEINIISKAYHLKYF